MAKHFCPHNSGIVCMRAKASSCAHCTWVSEDVSKRSEMAREEKRNNERAFKELVKSTPEQWRQDKLIAAKELGYSDTVINAIVKARNETEANNVLKSARLAD